MSMLRSVLTYMGLGPDEDYDDGYLYEADRRSSSTRPGRLDGPSDETIDLRDGADPHAQRRRPTWMGRSDGADTVDAVDDLADLADLGGDLSDLGDLDDVDLAEAMPDEAETISGYDDLDDVLDDEAASPRGRHDANTSSSDVRQLRAVPTDPGAVSGSDGVKVRSVSNHGDDRRNAVSEPRQAQATILAPRSFGDAKILADEFKAQAPLVMNLQEVDRELARRLIDFASGICYALDGGMEKIASQVFLLIPDSVEVSDEERRRLEQLGFGR